MCLHQFISNTKNKAYAKLTSKKILLLRLIVPPLGGSKTTSKKLNSSTLKSNKMRRIILIAVVNLVGLTAVQAQKWSDLTQEEKIMKAKEFRADNQKYLKDSLGM